MNRRAFLQAGVAAAVTSQVVAALKQERLDEAVRVLTKATTDGPVSAAVMHVRQRETSFTRAFGKAESEHAMFLLGSISKPICMTALMTLFDQGAFKLDDPLQKFLPQFRDAEREAVTLRHLLSHSSGLPDQLPENDSLRKQHASLSQFAEHAMRTPLSFKPGSRYQYSSMGILLAARVAELISKTDILTLVEKSVFKPLGMQRSAQGLGRFKLEDFVPMQMEFAAVEAGGGDPSAKNWDWNSSYWRKLGAPWGGTHASAADIGRFLAEFLNESGLVVRPETARLMTRNHNAPGLTPRGLGLNIGAAFAAKGCSEKSFGHTGSTGTIAWADPETQTICVVLTSLPARAVTPHPRDLAAGQVAEAMRE